MNRDRAGNTLRKARKIDLKGTSLQLKDAIGSGDTDDLYRFRLTGSSQVNIALTQLKANANLQLLALKSGVSQASKQLETTNFTNLSRRDINRYLIQVAQSKRGGKQGEQIIATLPAGIYYIRVLPKGSARTTYTLEAVAHDRTVISAGGISGLDEVPRNNPVTEGDFPGKSSTGNPERETELVPPTPTPPTSPTPTPTPTPTSPTPTPTSRLQQQWIQQFGTRADDQANGLVVSNAQDVYVVGATGGSLQGTDPQLLDAFIRRYSPDGTPQWVQSEATPGFGEEFARVAIDGVNTIYAVGTRDATAPSLANVNASNASWVKYNSNGDRLLGQTFNTGKTEAAMDIALGTGNTLHLVGQVTSINSFTTNLSSIIDNDGFIATYDATGTLLGQQLLNLPGLGSATGIVVDDQGNRYVTGEANGAITSDLSVLLGIATGATPLDPDSAIVGKDAFVAKYSADGRQLWFNSLASRGNDVARDVALDAQGNVYITGYTTGSLPGGTGAGSSDAFLAKYDNTGNPLWVKQFGTTGVDRAEGIAIDGNGNIYLAGETGGALLGGSYAGNADAYVAQFDSTGNLVTATQFGTTGDDRALGIALDSAGGVYLSGLTTGNLGGSNQGSADAWVAKYSI